MDGLTRAWYGVEVDGRLRKATGNAFQDIFAGVMQRVYPNGDYMPTRPWGPAGDRKSDGYLRSERTLFAVYAPVDIRPLAKAITKIRSDFDGALPYWEKYFGRWTLVLNDDALPADVAKLILELAGVRTEITCAHMLRADVLAKAMSLTPADLLALFGVAPSLRDLVDLGYGPVQTILDHIATQSVAGSGDVTQVAPGKLAANALSGAVRTMLEQGFTRSPLVDRFFREYHDPTYGDRISDSFKAKYVELKEQELPADAIYHELRTFAAGQLARPTDEELAVHVVLAYLFERCDIFEPARDAGL